MALVLHRSKVSQQFLAPSPPRLQLVPPLCGPARGPCPNALWVAPCRSLGRIRRAADPCVRRHAWGMRGMQCAFHDRDQRVAPWITVDSLQLDVANHRVNRSTVTTWCAPQIPQLLQRPLLQRGGEHMRTRWRRTFGCHRSARGVIGYNHRPPPATLDHAEQLPWLGTCDASTRIGALASDKEPGGSAGNQCRGIQTHRDYVYSLNSHVTSKYTQKWHWGALGPRPSPNVPFGPASASIQEPGAASSQAHGTELLGAGFGG